jgi:hypothetical protein
MMLKKGGGKWIYSKARLTITFTQNDSILVGFQTLLHIYLIFVKNFITTIQGIVVRKPCTKLHKNH